MSYRGFIHSNRGNGVNNSMRHLVQKLVPKSVFSPASGVQQNLTKDSISKNALVHIPLETRTGPSKSEESNGPPANTVTSSQDVQLKKKRKVGEIGKKKTLNSPNPVLDNDHVILREKKNPVRRKKRVGRVKKADRDILD